MITLGQLGLHFQSKGRSPIAPLHCSPSFSHFFSSLKPLPDLSSQLLNLFHLSSHLFQIFLLIFFILLLISFISFIFHCSISSHQSKPLPQCLLSFSPFFSSLQSLFSSTSCFLSSLSTLFSHLFQLFSLTFLLFSFLSHLNHSHSTHHHFCTDTVCLSVRQ